MSDRKEIVGLRKDGSEFPAEASISKVRLGGELLVTVILQDITLRKEWDEQLRQAQKMEAVGQLTGGIAHDFNNLLAVVLGNAELLTNGALGDDAKLQSIVRAAERGAELTQSLLAFSRKQSLSPQEINLIELITGMSDMLQRSLGETIEITTSLHPDLWTAMADPGQVENALLNLAINARDAMPGGGKLMISCRNVAQGEVYFSDDEERMTGDYVMLTVNDTGTGMDAESLKHVFEPFYTTKEVGKGSGLGLSMVHGFAKQSGGQVEIFSEQGQGTTVKLYLPRAAHELPESEPRKNDSIPLGMGETVLVVEDDEDVRMLSVKMLEGLGYRVIEASDAAAARLILTAGTKIHLLLSDVILPGGTSGCEFAKEMRDRGADFKIIFMSGYSGETVKGKDSLDAGSMLLRKPFHRQQLAKAVREALD